MYFEITINHPRTTGFKNMLSKKQKIYLYNIFQSLIIYFNNKVLNHDHVYELCQDGQIHLHGWIQLQEDEFEIPAILVNDISKILFKALPKKSQYSEKNFYPQFLRYRSPAICVQYTDNIVRFQEYMKKSPV